MNRVRDLFDPLAIGANSGHQRFTVGALDLANLPAHFHSLHHSNVKLLEGMERRLGWIIMTPWLHGIHHAAKREGLNSNWSSGFTIWDLLHGTCRWGQDDGTIGVPAYQDHAEMTFARYLVIPFEHQRDDWAQVPDLPHTAIAPLQLDPLPAVQP